MVTGLYLSSTLLTDDIKDVKQQPEPRLLETLLLDGSPHLQSVGTAPLVANIDLRASDAQAEAIDVLIAAGTILTIKWLGRYSTGYIRAVQQWTEVGYRYYAASVQLVVSSTGNQT